MSIQAQTASPRHPKQRSALAKGSRSVLVAVPGSTEAARHSKSVLGEVGGRAQQLVPQSDFAEGCLWAIRHIDDIYTVAITDRWVDDRSGRPAVAGLDAGGVDTRYPALQRAEIAARRFRSPTWRLGRPGVRHAG